MADYSEIKNVSVAPQYGTAGPDGWGFSLFSHLSDDEAPHRLLLERLAAAYPEAGIILPDYERYEDFVECYAVWNSASVWIYYETILSHLWLWSADRDAVEGIRTALLLFVDYRPPPSAGQECPAFKKNDTPSLDSA